MIDSVLLIRPKAEGKMEFPFGLLYVGTALKEKGYKVQIIDLHDTPERENQIKSILLQNPNMILGISALSASYSWVKKLTLDLKKQIPNLKIVIGGHIAVMNELLLNKTGVDYVCLGEGEPMLPSLIQALNYGQELENVLSTAFKRNGQIIKTSPCSLIKEFTLPDFSLVQTERYFIHPTQDRFFRESQEYQKQKKLDDRLTTIMFSRGCLGACNFCYRHIPGYRQGSLNWAFKYLMTLYNDYGVRYFRIDDELFATDKEWFDQLYQKIMANNLNILFRVSGLRVDHVTDELLDKMKKMGCIAINYGIESGSQEILNRMNKLTQVSQNIKAIQKTLNRGMKVMAYIMLGYQDETKKTLKETMDMLLATDLEPRDVSLFYTVPLPGTRLYQDCLKNGLIKDEEVFMEKLYTKIRDQYERYLIQLGQVSRDELTGFRKKLLFLLSFKRFFSKDGLIFKAIQKVVFLIPYRSRFNSIFLGGEKLLNKIYYA